MNQEGIYHIKIVNGTVESEDDIVIVSNNYISKGLILRYDGIENTRSGNNPNSTSWEDLSGNGNDGELKNIDNNDLSKWEENGLKLDGRDDGVYIGSKLVNLFKQDNTIEITIEFDESKARDIIIGNNSTSNCINYEKSSSSELSNKVRIYFDAGKINKTTNTEILTIKNKQNLTWVVKKNLGELNLYRNANSELDISNTIIKDYNYDWTNVWIGRDHRTR